MQRIFQTPRCCGKEMKAGLETHKFLELSCDKCGDTVYIKKEAAARPQMLDD